MHIISIISRKVLLRRAICQEYMLLRNTHSLLRNSHELIMTFHITLGVQSSNKVDRKDKHITSRNGPHPFPTSKKYYSSQIKSLKPDILHQPSHKSDHRE